MSFWSASATRFRTSSRLPWASSRCAVSTSCWYEASCFSAEGPSPAPGKRRGSTGSGKVSAEDAGEATGRTHGRGEDAVGVRPPVRVPDLLLRGLLRRLERVQHLLLHVRG